MSDQRSRRDILLLGAAAVGLRAGGAMGETQQMLTRVIPSTGELLPAVGMGTWSTFDVGSSKETAPLHEVLSRFFATGARCIDSSPMYGRAEQVVGELLPSFPASKPFLATKIWTSGREAGIAQMRRSIQLMGRGGKLDLMQVHNLLDWRVHLPTLREWKANGTIRYWGITHYQLSAMGELEQIVRSEKPDFVQLPYSLGVREAEKRLLPACAEHGAAVLVMRPFEGGSLFRDARKKPLPAWAAEIDCTSWAQIFLKFILGHPAVTCPIPASSNPDHMADDLKAGFGRLPDEALRKRMVAELS